MNPTITAKLERIDRMNEMLMALRVEAEELEVMTGVPALDYVEIDETDYLDKEEMRAIIRGYRSGHSAQSIATEEVPSAAQVERPRTTPAAKPTLIEQDITTTSSMYAQTVGRSKRPATEQSTGGTDWLKWTDPQGEGEPPVEVDDAIAYRIKSGDMLTTDYPHCLNWCHEGDPSDIVEYRLLTAEEAKAQSPWAEWPGGECPVDPSTKVQTRLFCYGRNDVVLAGLEQWAHNPKGHRNYDANIVAYRVVS